MLAVMVQALKSGKSGLRGAPDNLADEKSKALYSDNGLNTFKDSHIYSVQRL